MAVAWEKLEAFMTRAEAVVSQAEWDSMYEEALKFDKPTQALAIENLYLYASDRDDEATPAPAAKPKPKAISDLEEKAGTEHEFSCLMALLPPGPAQQLLRMGQRIADDKLAHHGREDEAHVTVKYGLHTNDASELVKYLAGQPPLKIKFGKLSLFKNDEFDVLKIDIESEALNSLNARITEDFECTTTHPVYLPHATIAYLKKGEGRRFLAMPNTLEGAAVTIDELVFSDKKHDKTPIFLGGEKYAKGFCPTGPGGGIDNSCGREGGKQEPNITISKRVSSQDIKDCLGITAKPEQLALAAGAIDGADVEFSVGEDLESINIRIQHPKYHGSRAFHADGSITNHYFGVRETGSGLGTEIFKNQVEAASALGFKKIRTDAEGQPGTDMNGYYTWPRLGYDAPFDSDMFPPAPGNPKRISDLMKTAKGRAWWKANGSGIEVTFDLTAGSKSRKVLDAYIAAKAGKVKEKGFCPTGPGGGIDNSCSPKRGGPDISGVDRNTPTSELSDDQIKTLFGVKDDYIYHTTSQKTPLASFGEGIKPNPGMYGTAVYMGNTIHATQGYHVDSDDEQLLKIDKVGVVRHFGRYPAEPDGLQYDDHTGEITLDGEDRNVPAEFIHVFDEPNEEWVPLFDKLMNDEMRAEAEEMEKGYDPNQPRADNGQWTSGAGGASSQVDPAAAKAEKKERKRQIMEATEGIPHADIIAGVRNAQVTPEKLFKTDAPGAKIVPISKLQNIRAREDGIANAARLMYGAATGHPAAGARDPISVQLQPDGQYRVYDGNSTYAVLKEAGWENAVVREVDSKGVPLAEGGRVDIRTASMYTRKEQNLPLSTHQPVKTKAELYSKAPVAHAAYDASLDHGQGVDQALGAKTIRPHNGDEYEAALNAPGPLVLIAGLKGEDRANEKVSTRYNGDWSRLKDVVRATVAVDSKNDIPSTIATIREEMGKRGWHLSEAPNNRMEVPIAGGYRDINTVWKHNETGFLAEMQINTKAMLKAKQGEGHKLYEEYRAKAEPIKYQGRKATPKEMDELDALEAAMHDVYRKAWAEK